MMGKKTLGFSILFVALGLRLIGGDVANFSYFVLAGYALYGRAQVIQALALLWLFSFISPAIAMEASLASICRFMVIGCAAISVLLHSQLFKSRDLTLSRPIFATLALGLFFLIHSMLLSEVPDVSILKVISWLAVVVTLLAAWGGLNYQERIQLERQLFGGVGLLMLISLPLAFIDIGYFNNGFGFQGVLNQSQAFGMIAAILSSWLTGRLSETVRYRWLDLALLGLSLVLLLISETRTAGFALVLAVISATLIFSISMRVTTQSLKWVLIALFIGMAAGVIWSDQLGAFIFKRDNATDMVETAVKSRGILVYPMIDNIVKYPVTGIGFGVASEPDSRWIDRDNMLGLPSSAPVEKGVLPLAVLEEVGVIGLIFVIAWLWVIVRCVARTGFTAFLVVLTLLFTNLGEASLFSAGGMGLLFLILLAWAVTGKKNIYPGAEPAFGFRFPGDSTLGIANKGGKMKKTYAKEIQ